MNKFLIAGAFFVLLFITANSGAAGMAYSYAKENKLPAITHAFSFRADGSFCAVDLNLTPSFAQGAAADLPLGAAKCSQKEEELMRKTARSAYLPPQPLIKKVIAPHIAAGALAAGAGCIMGFFSGEYYAAHKKNRLLAGVPSAASSMGAGMMLNIITSAALQADMAAEAGGKEILKSGAWGAVLGMSGALICGSIVYLFSAADQPENIPS